MALTRGPKARRVQRRVGRHESSSPARIFPRQLPEVLLHVLPTYFQSRGEALPGFRSARTIEVEVLEIRDVESILEVRTWVGRELVCQPDAASVFLPVTVALRRLSDPGESAHLQVRKVAPFLKVFGELRKLGDGHA